MHRMSSISLYLSRLEAEWLTHRCLSHNYSSGVPVVRRATGNPAAVDPIQCPLKTGRRLAGYVVL